MSEDDVEDVTGPLSCLYYSHRSRTAEAVVWTEPVGRRRETSQQIPASGQHLRHLWSGDIS